MKASITELRATRAVLKCALEEASVERVVLNRRVRLYRAKYNLEKGKREEAYTTVARLRSEIAELKLNLRTPCQT